MVEDSLEWLTELADLIPEGELDRRIDEIEAKLLRWGRVREALRQMKTARLLAVEAVGRRPAADPAEPIEPQLSPDQSNGDRPNTRDAVRAIFRDAGDVMLTMNQIMAELKARDWLPEGDDPRRLVNAAISGMIHRNHELETVARGVYRPVREDIDPLPLVEGESGSGETASNRLFLGSADGEAES